MITLEIAANRKQIVLGDHAEICCALKPKYAIAIAVNSFVQ